jgi:alpha-tubulin suppressor-like RCC1 family protein
MPTVVTKIVRYTGGDYTSLAAALAAVPSNLVTADQQWDILIAESAAGNYEWNAGNYGTSISGKTTDATRFIRIKPYPGLGFSDRSATGPANYDPIKGIALYGAHGVLGNQCAYTVIEGLQLKQTQTTFLYSGSGVITSDSLGQNSTLKNCIITSNYDGVSAAYSLISWFTNVVINCLFVSKGCYGIANASAIINSTIINTGAYSARTAIINEYSNPIVKNCAIFGFDTLFTGGSGVTFSTSSNNNATNLSSGPTNWGSNSLTGLTTSAQFVDTTTGTGNFRLRKSSPLIRGGTRDATYTSDLDIVGRARSLTLPSIGSWEEPSASGTVFPANIRFPIRDANGAATSTVVDMGDMFLRKEQYLTAGLWTWGIGDYGATGQNSISDTYSPVQVGTLTTWRQVSCGYRSGAAIKTDGTLWTWGWNGFGQLGQGDTADRSSPVQVGTLTSWKSLVCGYGTVVALKTDGTMWAWGRDGYGELGQGNIVDYSSPVQVGTLTDWKQISAGSFHVLATKNDGTLWAWGENAYFGVGGWLGLNTSEDAYSSPVQVGSLTTWKQVAASARSSAAIKTDGTLWTWGTNSSGELGVGNTINYSSPVQVGALTTWRSVIGGRHHMAAITNDGKLWMWGQNSDGALGSWNTTDQSSPVQVGSLSNWKQISCGYGWTTAIKTDGTLWSWGRNNYGQLANGNSGSGSNTSSPVQVGTLTSWKSTVYGSCGYYHTAAIQSPDLP